MTKAFTYTAITSLVLMAAIAGCQSYNPPLATVDSVDLQQYAGKWYEIARYDNWFQRNCVGVTATYTPLADGRIEVVNLCRERTLDGPIESIEGTARVVDGNTNAKLKVQFFPPFEGDYWILELGPEYEYAVVGEPGRRFLWILSREPIMDDEIYEDILAKLPAMGYDPGSLIRTPQAPPLP